MPFCMLFSLSEVLTSGTIFLPDKWIQCLNKEPLRIHTVQKRPWAMSWAGHIFCRFCGDSPPGFLFFLGCWRLASYKLPSWWAPSLPGAVGLLAASFIMCISHIIFSASSGYWAWDQRPLLFSQMQGALPTFHCPCREFRAYIWPAAPIKENVFTHPLFLTLQTLHDHSMVTFVNLTYTIAYIYFVWRESLFSHSVMSG